MFKSLTQKSLQSRSCYPVKCVKADLRLFDAEITCQQASGLSYSYNNAYYCVTFASRLAIRNAQLTYFSEAEVFRWPVATDFWLPVGVPLLFSWPLPLLQLSVWSALQQYCTYLSALNPDPAVNHNIRGYKRKTVNTKNYTTCPDITGTFLSCAASALMLSASFSVMLALVEVLRAFSFSRATSLSNFRSLRVALLSFSSESDVSDSTFCTKESLKVFWFIQKQQIFHEKTSLEQMTGDLNQWRLTETSKSCVPLMSAVACFNASVTELWARSACFKASFTISAVSFTSVASFLWKIENEQTCCSMNCPLGGNTATFHRYGTL